MDLYQIRSVLKAVFGEIVEVQAVREDEYEGWDIAGSYGIYQYEGLQAWSLEKLVRSPGGKYEPPSVDSVRVADYQHFGEALVAVCRHLAEDIATNTLDILATDAQAKEMAEDTY